MWISSRLGFPFLQNNRAVAAGSAEYYIGLFGLTEKNQSYNHVFLSFLRPAAKVGETIASPLSFPVDWIHFLLRCASDMLGPIILGILKSFCFIIGHSIGCVPWLPFSVVSCF
jgi:hypothetical protein